MSDRFVHWENFLYSAVCSAPSDHALSPLPLPQGIVGNLSSGKSALVHRYLTGTYVQEESPEGERPRLAWAPSFLLSVAGPEPLALLRPPVSSAGSCGFLPAWPREHSSHLCA